MREKNMYSRDTGILLVPVVPQTLTEPQLPLICTTHTHTYIPVEMHKRTPFTGCESKLIIHPQSNSAIMKYKAKLRTRRRKS